MILILLLIIIIIMDGKLGHSCARVMKGKFSESRVKDHIVHLGINVRSSANNCGCVVDGSNAIATI